MARVIYTPNSGSTPIMSRTPSPTTASPSMASPTDVRVPCTLNTNLLHCPCCEKARQETTRIRTDFERIRSEAIQASKAKDSQARRHSKPGSKDGTGIPSKLLICLALLLAYNCVLELHLFFESWAFDFLLGVLVVSVVVAHLWIKLARRVSGRLERAGFRFV
ncbi:uncharacterized protein APUU_51384A [Aspergillus puulaauensis]|uniref:Uncharacterized protein n=1 Tax=Aspergillus puulaauensis TaxID=1220207 RepID=A0A7R7XTH8_9EURO|nr:uncharacterized protein APUU_51384A [Aspergillus puulaauensis]BCS26673.1 hypothetical protein APUU_51384A [Aspergillus puulaauensis]